MGRTSSQDPDVHAPTLQWTNYLDKTQPRNTPGWLDQDLVAALSFMTAVTYEYTTPLSQFLPRCM